MSYLLVSIFKTTYLEEYVPLKISVSLVLRYRVPN